MVEYDSRLNNFFGCTVVQSQKQKIVSGRKFSINLSGKFYEVDSVCPGCNSTRVVHNGNDKCKSKFVEELGLVIKRGKFKCKTCHHTWTTYYKDAELFVQQYKQLINTTVFNLCCNDLSLDKIVEHISTVFSKKISHEWVRQLYINAAKTIEQKKVLQTSGIFHYDEQYTKVNKKEYVRVVVIDSITKKVIFDETTDNSRIETLKDKINMKMLPYKKEAFVVDLALGYPAMLKDLFPDIKVQWCLFHLNKLIIKDFESSKKLNKYGRKILPLQEIYNQYLLFDLFFNHKVELNFLKRQLKKLSEKREILKSYEEKDLISFYEMKLISEFSEFRKSLKKHRRKYKNKYLLRRIKQESLEILKKLVREISFFPKQVQKRIKRIRKNFDKLTLFQENPLIPPTNNTIEQYYSATLQKTKKKKFRCKESLHLKLKITREKWNQTLENLKFNFLEFLQLFAKIHYFFGPT